MDDESSGSSTAQTLASVLAGGLAGYIDSQNQQPVYVQQPLPQTPYGYAGTSQNTVSSLTSGSGLLLLGLVAVVAVVMLKR